MPSRHWEPMPSERKPGEVYWARCIAIIDIARKIFVNSWLFNSAFGRAVGETTAATRQARAADRVDQGRNKYSIRI